MNKKLLRYTICGILFTAAVGTLSHFIYEWSGKNFFVSFFTPTNESTWEHMKMIFFPLLFYSIFENRRLKKDYPSIYCANAAAILTGTFSIPVIFYTYTGILGRNYLPLDIFTFLISIVIAFIFRCYYIHKKTGKSDCRLMESAVLLLFICFLVFTLYPPDIGLFRIP